MSDRELLSHRPCEDRVDGVKRIHVGTLLALQPRESDRRFGGAELAGVAHGAREAWEIGRHALVVAGEALGDRCQEADPAG